MPQRKSLDNSLVARWQKVVARRPQNSLEIATKSPVSQQSPELQDTDSQRSPRQTTVVALDGPMPTVDSSSLNFFQAISLSYQSCPLMAKEITKLC